eukprot:jgi/Orpsp1_1/1176428/evm.model.c7180000057549.2
MRPDPYKQKKSRRYQLTHKNKIANKDDNNKDNKIKNREQNSNNRDSTTNNNNINDNNVNDNNNNNINDNNVNDNNNNNNNNNNSENVNKNKIRHSYNKKSYKKYNEDEEENTKSYGRRKIFDNSYRYEEPTYEEQLEAEADIDVAVEDALSLINSQENVTAYDPSSYFQFKKENWINNEEFSENDNKIQEIFKLDFNKLDKSLQKISIWDRIKINKDFIINDDDTGYVDEAKKVNKIMPSYNYIRNDSISLNNKFNFNISTEHDSSNTKDIKENVNNEKTEIETKIENNTPEKKEEKIEKETSSKPVNNDIDFDIDELINDTKPLKSKTTNEVAIEG